VETHRQARLPGAAVRAWLVRNRLWERAALVRPPTQVVWVAAMDEAAAVEVVVAEWAAVEVVAEWAAAVECSV